MASRTTSFSGLRELRESLLGFRPATVVELTGIDRARLEAIECGEAEPAVFELERLADAYGVDADLLWDEPIVVPAGHGVHVLASLDEFQELGDMTRARVVRAANAARDLVSLRRRLGVKTGSLPALQAPDLRAEPYRQGADLAHQLRKQLGLGTAPIESVRDLVATKLGAVAVLAADLGRESRLAGLGFADESRGLTVVLNRFGKNENAAVRRFSLAHELCHLFADRTGEPLASISGYLSEKGLDRERRANSFAIRFLCPESVVQGLRNVREEDAMRVLMDEYKLPYQATRLYLRNEANLVLPDLAPDKLPDPLLEGREALPAVLDFPLAEVPFERRGVLAALAVRAWCRGLIPRDACARYLGVTPGHPIERVADFFGEELDDESSAA